MSRPEETRDPRFFDFIQEIENFFSTLMSTGKKALPTDSAEAAKTVEAYVHTTEIALSDMSTKIDQEVNME